MEKIKNRTDCQYFTGSGYYFNGKVTTRNSDDKK